MIETLLLQAPPVADSPYSLAGILAIIAAVVGGIISIITAWRTGSQVKEVKDINRGQDQKLDTITVLVNGRYYQVLQELADVWKRLAAATGSDYDQNNAKLAQQRADDQANRVLEAERRQYSREAPSKQ